MRNPFRTEEEAFRFVWLTILYAALIVAGSFIDVWVGLGVFIARTLLERTGAKVSFTNRIFPDHGAVVQIAWPRSRFEAAERTVGLGEINESPIS